MENVKAYTSIVSENDAIHSVMKQPSRRIYGKVHITYTDPLLNDVVYNVSTNGNAYNSNPLQLVDSLLESDKKYFTLYENNLLGDYYASSSTSQTGWSSSAISDSDGYFSVPPVATVSFDSRPIINFNVYFDEVHQNTATDFTVEFVQANGTVVRKTFTDNALYIVPVVGTDAIGDVTSIRIIIERISRPAYPATVMDMSVSSEFVYVGYQDESNLVSISMLEELTYDDDIEALGGMSANEVTVVLDNSDRMFNMNNEASPISKQLNRNRKIQPYLGAEVTPGTIEWYPLGTYWAYKWDVPVDNLTASVIGFDTIGLLSLTSYTNHQVMSNKSLGELIDIVLTNAKETFSFLQWTVDTSLYSVIIPYAWFAAGSHAAALRKICSAYPMHIYCNREGHIVAAPQRLHLDYYYDTWSNDTNIIEKTYNSLYAVLPNIINVKIARPTIRPADTLVEDELQFDIADMPVRVLNFSAPYVSNISVDVDCDGSVQYTYKVYSWGIEISFVGVGNVYSIKCTGTSLDTSNTATITHRDETSIRVNGVVTRDIAADFIQTNVLANYLISRLRDLAEFDNYDVEVTYRGDIALTINDPILLLDGILPSNVYNIKRHKLHWDGGLSGVANLNT